MEKFVVNDLGMGGYCSIITILDYQIKISECIQEIRIYKSNCKILIDSVLCSGENEYRFIETCVNDVGEISLNDYKYITVDNSILSFANSVLKKYPFLVSNSVLPYFQYNKILQH